MTLEAGESCRRCGVGMRGGATFCKGCGASLLGTENTLPARTSRVSLPVDAQAWDRLREALIFFGVLLGTSLVATVANKFAPTVTVTWLLSVVDALLITAYALRHFAVLRPLLLQRPGALPWGRTIMVLVGFVVIANVYFTMLGALGVPLLRVTDDLIAASWPRWAIYLLISVQPAIFEELAFRGIVLDKLERSLGKNEAWLVQAAMFSVLHLSPVIFPSHFMMGLAFGWLRVKSGSLYPGMLAHAAWNAWTVYVELSAT